MSIQKSIVQITFILCMLGFQEARAEIRSIFEPDVQDSPYLKPAATSERQLDQIFQSASAFSTCITSALFDPSGDTQACVDQYRKSPIFSSLTTNPKASPLKPKYASISECISASSPSGNTQECWDKYGTLPIFSSITPIPQASPISPTSDSLSDCIKAPLSSLSRDTQACWDKYRKFSDPKPTYSGTFSSGRNKEFFRRPHEERATQKKEDKFLRDISKCFGPGKPKWALDGCLRGTFALSPFASAITRRNFLTGKFNPSNLLNFQEDTR